MGKDGLAHSERSRFHSWRRMLIPDWLWEWTWLRHLPEYYRSIAWNDCPRPRLLVVFDLLYIFFIRHQIPEHYGPCRLWRVPRKQWVRYYGCPYTPRNRRRIGRAIYPFEYEILYDDKLVGARLAQGLNIRQPHTLGVLNPAQQWRESLQRHLTASASVTLMLKPVFGRSGIGIVLAERTDDGIIIRTGRQDLPLREFMLDCPVLVQEIIRQDERIAAIWSGSVNTLRIVTLMTRSDEIRIVGCGMRFGVGRSFVDNWSAGGVAVGIDARTGRLRPCGFDKSGNIYRAHPGSQIQFDGFQVPEWDRILAAAQAVQRELPFSRITGVDICLDAQANPVLIEINGLPDLVLLEQLNGPLLADPELLRAFADYDMLSTRGQRRLAASILSDQPNASTPGRAANPLGVEIPD